MSDEWLFYPCQAGEHKASVFYDHGIRKTIDQIAPQELLKIQLTFKNPRLDGLSSDEEFQQLTAVEDSLRELVGQYGAIYVGRITVDGHRYFHIFTADSEAAWSARLRAFAECQNYEIRFLLERDEKRDGYWKDLYPSEDSWQVIEDMRVLEALERNGDDGTASRRIDHWAFFPTQDAAEEYMRGTQEKGYVLDSRYTTEDGKFSVCFSHEGTVRLSDITSHTIALRRKASQLGGDYDEWETPVCKRSD
jgi:hypothetical protein